jgi:hypothetical protein
MPGSVTKILKRFAVFNLCVLVFDGSERGCFVIIKSTIYCCVSEVKVMARPWKFAIYDAEISRGMGNIE